MRPISFAEFVVVWNERQGLTTPQLHVNTCRWLEARWHAGKRDLLLLAFRNSGKSTLVGLFAAWLLSGAPALRILVLAADFALARKMVRNVKRILERHPLTGHLKPRRADQWASDQFTVERDAELRDPSMLAKGIGANITGSRADVIICDDVEVPNTCDTEPKRVDLRQRLDEIGFVLVPGGLTLFTGTPHTFFSIYAPETRAEYGEGRPYLAGFERLELSVLDERGRSRWPERFSTERIEAMKHRQGPAKFASQMMVRPVNSAEGRLDPDRLKLYDAELVYSEGGGAALLTLNGRRLVSASCWWDPAYGAKDKGDASVVAAVFTDEDGGYWLHRIAYLTVDPAATEIDEATQHCRQVADFVDRLHLPAVTVETNGIGRFLPGLLRRAIAETETLAAVLERASTRAKDIRIVEAFDAPLAAGRLHAHRAVWATPFIAEMREWRPGENHRDDGLDAVSGCLLAEPVRLSRRPAESRPRRRPGDWRPGTGRFEASTEFNP